MKILHLIPLMFLAACSTKPKLTLRPQQPPSATDNSTVRYPEVVRAYHFGRYVDPGDNLVMHEQHVVYRVEENCRWDLRPWRAASTDGGNAVFPTVSTPRDAAFSPLPVSDAELAEVNAQKMATVQIMLEVRTLSAALAQFQAAWQQARANLQETAVLRASVIAMQKRLDALEAAPAQMPAPLSITNEPSDSLSP